MDGVAQTKLKCLLVALNPADVWGPRRQARGATCHGTHPQDGFLGDTGDRPSDLDFFLGGAAHAAGMGIMRKAGSGAPAGIKKSMDRGPPLLQQMPSANLPASTGVSPRNTLGGGANLPGAKGMMKR